MKDDKIKESLYSKNFKIINVIKNINYKFDYLGNQIDFEEIMEKEDINKFFDELDKILSDTDELCFVIFQEYFFSYHLVIKEKNSELILNLTKEITRKKQNTVFIINLLYQFKEPKPTDDYEKKIEIYFKKIYDNDSKKIWEISSHNIKAIYGNQTDNYYSNETFIIMRGNILYKYKKASFYHETQVFRVYNYIIGFGEDEINEELKGELLEIAKTISNEISIEICYDLQNNIKTKKFDNLILFDNDPDLKILDKLKEIRKNVKDYSQKKLIIIQSNTTDIYQQIDIFPNNIIIAKSDPLQPMVFLLKNKEEIGEINNLELDHIKVVKDALNEGKSAQFKGKRLNNELSKLNLKCETRNITKLVKEFNSKKITKIEIGIHRFMIIEYDKFN